MARHTVEVNNFIETQQEKAEVGGSLSPKRRRQTSPNSTTTNTQVGPAPSPMRPVFFGKREMKVDLMGGGPMGQPGDRPGGRPGYHDQCNPRSSSGHTEAGSTHRCNGS